MMIGKHGCIRQLSCELRGMLASINIQFWWKDVVDTETSAALSEVEESFTVPELPDGSCEEEEDWCNQVILN